MNLTRFRRILFRPDSIHLLVTKRTLRSQRKNSNVKKYCASLHFTIATAQALGYTILFLQSCHYWNNKCYYAACFVLGEWTKIATP